MSFADRHTYSRFTSTYLLNRRGASKYSFHDPDDIVRRSFIRWRKGMEHKAQHTEAI